MSTFPQPNPPSRRGEDFPKTNTIPDGWVMHELMEYYNGTGAADGREEAEQDPSGIPVPDTGTFKPKLNGRSHPVESVSLPAPTEEDCDKLFTRRLEPFPSDWDMTGMWL